MKPKKRICRVCGQEFTTYVPAQKTCDDCRGKVTVHKKVGRTCPICNKKFDAHVSNQKFCDDCRENRKSEITRYLYIQSKPHKKERGDQVCPICGLLFTPNSNNQIYCKPCKTERKDEIKAYQNRVIAILERQNKPKDFPSIEDINRKIEEWFEKTGKRYSYGQYVFLQSIGRVP